MSKEQVNINIEEISDHIGAPMVEAFDIDEDVSIAKFGKVAVLVVSTDTYVGISERLYNHLKKLV